MKINEIRNYLNNIKIYIKLAQVCREIGIHPQALNTFLKGYDKAVSYSKLIECVNFIKKINL